MKTYNLGECDNFGCFLTERTFATELRDKIIKMPVKQRELAIKNFRNTHKTLIPKEYWSDVVYMTEYNKYRRLTDCVEQAMLDNVIGGIIKELFEEEGL